MLHLTIPYDEIVREQLLLRKPGEVDMVESISKSDVAVAIAVVHGKGPQAPRLNDCFY